MRLELPLLTSLKETSWDDLRADALAGLTTAIMLVPQAMAYAMLAGLDPIVGLYASTLPLAIYALVGSSRPLAVGPVAMDSLMVAAGLAPLVVAGSENYGAAAATMALMVGAIQLVLGVLRAGFLVRFLARPVITGFTAAAALIIGLSQLKSALGVELPRSQQVHVILLAAVRSLDQVHVVTMVITAVSVVTLLVLKKRAPKFPRFLLVVAGGTLAVWGLGLEQQGVAIVGDVPAGLPGLSLPSIDPAMLGPMFPIAFAIALVAMMEAISVAKRYEQDVKPNRELVGIGLANLGSGLVSGYPITGGFSRTAVNAEAGARSPLAGLVTSGVVVVTLIFLTDFFYFLPRAVLASIIMTAVFGLIDVQGLKALYRDNRVDFGVAVVTGVATLSVGIQLGMLTGVVVSLIAFLARTARPRVWDAGTDERELVLKVDGPLYFANVEAVQESIERLEADRDLERVVLDTSHFGDLDSVAQAYLDGLQRRYERAGIGVELLTTEPRLASAVE